MECSTCTLNFERSDEIYSLRIANYFNFNQIINNLSGIFTIRMGDDSADHTTFSCPGCPGPVPTLTAKESI